jgi:uncharacterized protein (TIGR03067 family)
VEALVAKPSPDPAEREFQLALGEEVNRLPDKYRVPLVLHCFDGKTSQEVAEQLGCAEATVRTRLARARERLRTRLVKRGLVLSAGVLAAGLSPSAVSAVPGTLIDLTIKAAARFAAGNASAADVASANAAVLAERVLKIMFLNKLKQVAAGVVLVGVFGSGAGLTLRQALADKPAVLEKDHAPKSGQEASQPKDDRTEIRGTWETWYTVTRSATGKLPSTQWEKRTWVITDDKILHVGEDGFLESEETFKLDPTQRPKAIDITDPKIGTVPGIYELEGDTLKLYYELDKRPSDFPSDKDLVKEMVHKRISRNFAPVPQRFANAPGCFWIINPGNPPASMSTLGITYFYDKDPDGAVVIIMAYPVRDTPSGPSRELRPVLLDTAGMRYLPKHTNGGSTGKWNGPVVALHRWRMDPNVLPAQKVAQIGIEAVTIDAHRIAAREALERAQTAKIEVLPWPEAGKPFHFTLTTIDGQKIRSEELKGRVVLLDCWATWCSPCMALMPELKALYKKWHPQGLEIVGISFDRDTAIMQNACKSQGLAWPQVWVPDEEKVRDLWQEVCGIGAIPRVLILDQQGILQADSADKLDEKIGKLLSNSPDKLSAKQKP